MEITSYHGLVESTSIHCDDRGIHTLFTDLVGGLKGTCTWMLQVYENCTQKANVIIESETKIWFYQTSWLGFNNTPVKDLESWPFDH